MESKNIPKILWKKKGLVLGLAALVVMISLIYDIFRPTRYNAYLDIETKRINKEETIDYRYDEYYAIEAANLTTETVNSWFRNQNFGRMILIKADFDQKSLPSLKRFVQTKKLSSQNLEIQVTAGSYNTTKKLAKTIKKEIENKVLTLNLNQEGQPSFSADVTIGKPEIIHSNLLYLIPASFFGGLLLGIFLVLLFYYFRK